MVTAMAHGNAKQPASTRWAWEIRRFDSIDSTNRYLIDQARSGAPEGLVAVADRQEAGRGRMGRTWVAPPGSALLVSALLRPALPPSRVHLMATVVALSGADACSAITGVSPDLKWPNDLVVGARKLGGVLAEAELDAERVAAVVVGMGLNVSWPSGVPPGIADNAVALSQLVPGKPPDRARLLSRFLEVLGARYQDLQSAGGDARQAMEYRRRCATLGQQVRVELVDESFSGVAADVSHEGHLIVDVGTCLRTVMAGDVVHLRRVAPP